MARVLVLLSLAGLMACDGKDTGTGTTVPAGDPVTGTPTGTTPTGTATGSTVTFPADEYAFESRFSPGETSVIHTGQTVRQILIKDMKSWIGGMTGRIDSGWFPTSGEVTAELEFYVDFDGASSGSVPMLLTTDPAAAQATYGEISTSANLVGKIAGNDAVGQHEDWSTAFVGWSDPAVTTPESLVRLWIQQLDDAAVDRSIGTVPLDPGGSPVSAIYLTAEGQDLQQLIEKFLHGAIGFSQAADDYLDDDTDGKGLLAGNAAAEDGKPYTGLEHAWDEGFAYFGAAHHYSKMSDDDIADVGWSDHDGDGAIDLNREICFGASGNAAKRDLGAVAATDFTADAWDGFHAGRTLIVDADGDLTADQMTQLQLHRDQALEAWEKVYAATVVHYINDTLQDMSTFGTASYSFEDHAKHWSEAKGFALAFQFNPRSPLSDSQFAELHGYLGQAPVLPTATPQEISDYRADLVAARTLLGTAYGFDAANLGDADGNGGW